MRATSAHDLREAYKVVHDTYVQSGFIMPTKSGIRLRPWETDVNTGTFVSKIEDQIIGVCSVVMDSDDLKLPSDKVFGAEMDAIRGEDRVLCEITGQAVVPDYRNCSVTTELMRAVVAHGWYKDMTDLICAISPNLVKFYEFIGFEQIGKIKSYSDVIDDPVALMRWDIKRDQERWQPISLDEPCMLAFWKRFFFVENVYINAIPLWNSMAERTFENSIAMAYLFEGCEELFDEATSAQLTAMEHRLGGDLRRNSNVEWA